MRAVASFLKTWLSSSSSEREGGENNSTEDSNRSLKLLSEGTLPGARESILVVNLAISVLDAGTASARVELLRISLESVADEGTAHVGAEAGTLWVRTLCAKVFGTGGNAGDEHG